MSKAFISLPSSTIVNRRLAKEKLYANAGLSPRVSAIMRKQVESIIWWNKLAENTLNISAGDTVEEIQIFEILLRQREIDKRVLAAISKAIPYKIVFILVFNDEAQAWVEALDTFYHTEWGSFEDLSLKLEGLNLDAVYENLVRQIAGGRLGDEGDIADAVERDRKRQKLMREIAILEKKVKNERQFNKQVALNGELRHMKEKLEDLY